MELTELRDGEAVVLAPVGDLTSPQDCALLERRLGQLIDGGARCLVLDCEKTTRVSAAAIRLLLLMQRRLVQARGGLVLCGLGEVVGRVFSISGFDRDFAIVAARPAAVARAVALAHERQQAPAPPPPTPRPRPEPAPVPPPPSPMALLAAEIVDLLAANAPAVAPAAAPLGPEALERCSALLVLALAGRRG